jgi:hypothetical protein
MWDCGLVATVADFESKSRIKDNFLISSYFPQHNIMQEDYDNLRPG